MYHTEMKHLFSHLISVTSAWRRALRLIWQTQPWFVISLLLLTMLSGLVPSAQIQLTSSIIQSAALAIRAGHDQSLVNTALLFGLFQGLLLLGSALLGIALQQIQTLFTLRLSNNVNILVMEKAASLDVQYYENDECYDMLQRAVNEGNYRPYQIFSQMSTLISQAVTLVSVVAVLLSWNWWLGLLILLAPLPAMGSQLFYSRRGYLIERERASSRRRLAYFQFLVTHAYSVKEIRLFRLADYFIGRYRQLYQDFYAVDSRLARQQSLVLIPFTILTNGVAAGAQIYAIAITIVTNHLGFLAGYIQAIGVVQGTVQSLLANVAQLYQNNLFVNNLFEFLDTPQKRIKSGTRKMPERLYKGIEFRGVSFAYPGTSTEVVHNLNLFLRAGECVALVGHNGAGKTTLVKLLTRLYEPTAGHILIDDVPLEEYDLNDLRQHISALFQDFVQYEMTVRENIGFGFLEKMQESQRIEQAARASGADSIIEEFPEKYETMLGRMFAKGHQLSGGQWQKIALARTFLRQAPIVIFDEPTAALDATSEAEIFERMQQIAAGATTLLVAHRFSTVRKADRILVIEQGKVIEDGSHEELLRLNGTYARLFRLQAAGYADPTAPRKAEAPRPIG
jgi:ATP-binding cassette subfamily B protein